MGHIEVPAVRGASFAVEPGEFVAIVGPSGSGKSTLFYLLGGLTRATEGRVVIDGVDFATPERRRTHPSAQTPHRLRLSEIQSTSHPLRHGQYRSRLHHQRPQGAARPQVPRPPERHALHPGRLKHRPSELSGGEQQRVAIARALVTRPAIVLADEPTGNLDTKNSDAVLHMLMRSNRELGQTTLMITHNPEAASIASRILVHARRADRARRKGFRARRCRFAAPMPERGVWNRSKRGLRPRFDPISAARYTRSCNKRE